MDFIQETDKCFDLN